MAIKRRKKSKLIGLMNRRRILTIVPIALFAVVGAYIIFSASAENGSSRTSVHITEDGTVASQDYPANSTFNLSFYSQPQIYGTEPTHGMVMLSFDRSRVEYQGFTCGTEYACNRTTYYNGTEWAFHHYINEILCFDIPSNANHQVTMFTVKLKSKVHLPGPYEVNWLVVADGSAPGTCSSNPDSTGGVFGHAKGSCPSENPVHACDTGSAINFGPQPGPLPNLGQDSKQSTNTGQTPTNAGSGGGGSSANKQANQDDAIPSSTSQGDQKQPDLDPSPFFDGKQYDPGSDPDILGIDTSFVVAGHNLKYGWLLVVVLLLAGGSGAGYWYWHKRQGK